MYCTFTVFKKKTKLVAYITSQYYFFPLWTIAINTAGIIFTCFACSSKKRQSQVDDIA